MNLKKQWVKGACAAGFMMMQAAMPEHASAQNMSPNQFSQGHAYARDYLSGMVRGVRDMAAAMRGTRPINPHEVDGKSPGTVKGYVAGTECFVTGLNNAFPQVRGNRQAAIQMAEEGCINTVTREISKMAPGGPSR